MTTILFIIVALLPYLTVVIISFLLLNVLLKIYTAKKHKDSVSVRKHTKRLLIGIAIVSVIAGVSVYEAWRYENKSSNNLKAIDFVVYGTDQKFNTEYIRDPGTISVPHVATNIVTSKGNIHINEAAVDRNISKLFKYPSNCNVQAIYEYTSIWGLREQKETEIECRSIVVGGSTWKLLTPVKPTKLDGSAPFAAMFGDTIIGFRAFSSSAGDFNGSYAEAEDAVIKFLTNSKPVSIQELLKN